MTLSHRDKKIIWHPFTQEKTAKPVVPIKFSKGAYIYDENDKAYLDLISSWWVNIHGHAHPDIANSIYEQATQLEHVIFAGFTHTPAVQLCENLSEILPAQLSRFFFSDNGSTAVETALKMAYQYWYNQGLKQRSIFLSFEGGYHGDTFGAMSVGSKSGFHNTFTELFFKVLSIPYPDTWDNDETVEIRERKSLAILDNYLEDYADKMAAIILEPLLQGASGMRICRPEFVKQVVERVRNRGILVIFDEVMTGFGRTGSYFALSQTGVIPDFLCLSKGITGGFLPLALTVTTNSVYNQFLNDRWEYALIHGHSYTANPIACAAAITSLKLLRQPSCQNALDSINQAHKKGLLFLNQQGEIKKSRVLGTVCAFELKNNPETMSELVDKFLQEGLLIRPLGNTIYLLPPYCITADELEVVYEKIKFTLSHIGRLNHRAASPQVFFYDSN